MVPNRFFLRVVAFEDGEREETFLARMCLLNRKGAILPITIFLMRVCRIAPAVEGKPPGSLTFRDVESLKTEHRSLVFIAATLFSITVVVAGEIEVSKRAAASDQ